MSIWKFLNSSKTEPLRQPAPPFVIDPDAPEPLEPLYFVAHPDNSFSVADPQPTTLPHSREQFHTIQSERAVLRFEKEMLKFLLSCAPMIEADGSLAGRGGTAFAYVHPKTLATFARVPGAIYSELKEYVFAPSPTKWICTSLMPEGRVIFSPNPLPGTEKRNEAHAVANRTTRKPSRRTGNS